MPFPDRAPTQADEPRPPFGRVATLILLTEAAVITALYIFGRVFA